MSKLHTKRRILIVGEGRETEYNYFVGFRNHFQKELEATATSVKVARGKGGNASDIVRRAINESKGFQADRKRGDRVVLLLDTEGPGRTPELPAAETLAQKNNIEIVYSSPSLEFWLLCHFAKAPRCYFNDCDSVIVELEKSSRWPSVCKGKKFDKADEDIFERLSTSIEIARVQALEVDLNHIRTGGRAYGSNPSSQVYELIASLIGVQTGEKCPVDGEWKLVENPLVTVKVQKGHAMPAYDNESVHWRL